MNLNIPNTIKLIRSIIIIISHLIILAMCQELFQALNIN